MARIQLSSLDEFVASLSRLDYEAAKVASGKVMEDHIRMGALMFSLLTIEMMYTSMDYLTPENYRRGNSYLLNMYSPLPRQLNKLLRKLVSEYEEEHQRLLSLNAQAASRGSAVHSLYDTTTHGSVHDLGSQSGLAGDNDASRRRLFASQTIHLNGSGSQHANSEATSGSRLGSSGSGSNKLHSEHRKQAANIGTARPATEYHTKGIQTGRGTAEPFDPNQYLANMEEAEVVLKELETVRQFVEFITKFVEVRKTMVVLYRFVAVTGPVLYVPKLRVMLDSCKDIIQAIEPNPLYASLLEHMRYEIWLVSSLVDWNSHVIAYDIVQAVTHMKKAKQLLRTWQDTLPAHDRPEAGSSRRSTGGHSIYESIGDAIGGRRDRDAGAGQPASHGLLYTALAKSSRMVQNLLWRGGGLGSGDDAQSQSADGMRGIIIWVNAWFDYLSFKTTIFFQQIIAPYRSLYHDDMTVHAKQAAVMSDTWSRPGVAKTNLYEIVSEFMQANDGCFVALLFESSKQRPFAADGFAIAGTKVDVPDYRVQACAVLFCFANQRLLRSRGISVKDTLVHDVHANRPDPATRGTEAQQQSEVEWFRQNCLPDILYVLDSDRATLDYELLGSSPLLNRLGADADELLVELCDSVHDTVEEAIAQLAISKEAENARLVAERGAHSAAMGDLQPGTAKSHSGQASEALRLSAMKTLSSADQRQQQQHMSTQSESARHSPSIHSMPGNDHASTSDSHQYLNAPDGVSRSTAAMMASSSGSGMEPHRAQVSEGHDGDMNLSLYSTYLQKSHLRNNVQNPALARGPGGRRCASRYPIQHLDSSDNLQVSRLDLDPADQWPRTVHGSQGSTDSSYAQRLGGMAESRQRSHESVARLGNSREPTRNTASQKPSPQSVGSVSRRPAEPSTAVDYLTSKGSAGASRADITAWGSEQSAALRRVSADVSALHQESQGQPSHDSASLPRRSARATTTALGTASAKPRRPSLSIRSFFRQASRPSAQPAPVRASPENELMRRVRCGERLHELFGSWGEDKPDDVPEDGSAQRVGEHRPSSIHSLSFSAPTRASLGGRAGMATDTANYGANATPAALEAEGIGGRFVLRLPRTTDRAQQEHVQRKSSRPPATRRASEFGLGTAVEFLQNRSQPPRPPHEQPAKPQHLPHVAPHAGHQPTTPTTSGAEGYTYLYSRVGLPNVVLVAVILDSDKGLDRRREAEHAWDSVVDAVRGAPLFEQLMALSG